LVVLGLVSGLYELLCPCTLLLAGIVAAGGNNEEVGGERYEVRGYRTKNRKTWWIFLSY